MARELKSKVVLTAEDKTRAAFASAGKGVDSLQKKFSGIALASLAGAAGIGAAAAGLFLLTRRAIESADAIGKTADKVGLGVESLQELRFAAEQAGVEQATLDMAMQRFSRRVGEAVQGQGELKDTLIQYGIAVVDAQGKTRKLDDVLDDFADAIMNAGSSQEQLRLAFKGLDSEGAALVNMFRNGKVGLDEFRAEARRLGIVLDESMVRGAEDAADALGRMERVVGVNAQKLLLQLAPSIEQLAIAFSEAGPVIAEVVDEIARFIGGIDLLSIEGLTREIEKLNGEMLISNAAIGDATKLMDKQRLALEANTGWYEKQVAAIEALIVTREKEAAARKKRFAPGGDDGDGGTDKVAQQERARAEKMLVAIEATHLRVMGFDAELIDLRKDQELEKLAELHDAKLISELEFRRADLTIKRTALEQHRELETAHQDFLSDEAERGGRERAAAARTLARAELAARLGLHDGLGAIAALQNTQSRKMFEIGKAAAMSLALVKTYEGAQGVFASAAQVPFIGYLLAPVAAAAAIVSGLANVRAIAATSFGAGASAGGGGRGHGGAGGRGHGASVPALPPAPANDQQQPAQQIFLTIESDSGFVSTEWLRDQFAATFNEAVKDRVIVVT